jgi:hypothetical protein
LHVKGSQKPGVELTADKDGNYEVFADEPLPSGQYRARALKRTWKNGKATDEPPHAEGATRGKHKPKISVCRPGRSDIITIP